MPPLPALPLQWGTKKVEETHNDHHRTTKLAQYALHIHQRSIALLLATHYQQSRVAAMAMDCDATSMGNPCSIYTNSHRSATIAPSNKVTSQLFVLPLWRRRHFSLHTSMPLYNTKKNREQAKLPVPLLAAVLYSPRAQYLCSIIA